jgi:hypothetical protein
MYLQPSAIDRRLQPRNVFIGAAAGLKKRPVDLLDMDATVLHGFDRVGDLDQRRPGKSRPQAAKNRLMHRSKTALLSMMQIVLQKSFC